MLRNAFVSRWQGHEQDIDAHRDELQAEVSAAEARRDRTVAGISAGVSAGLIDTARPAGEIVVAIVEEAEHLLRHRPSQLLG